MAVQSNYIFLRSYVRNEEYDLTQIVDSNSGTIGAINGEFHRGPVTPTYVPPSQFYLKYGDKADPSLSFAWDSASVFSQASANMLLTRVTNEAFYAGADVVIDDDATYGQRVLVLPFAQGAQAGYDKSGKLNTSGVTLIKFSAALVTGDTFEMNITDGTTIVPVSVNFTSDHNTTMAAIALAINSAIQTFSPSLDGSAVVNVETVSTIAPRYTLVLRKPFDASIEFLGVEVSNGGSPKSIVTQVDPEDCWLFTSYAENPGKWGGDYGLKLTGIDQGVRPRYRITFSGPFVTGNTINMTINGVALAPVAFATDSDTTLQALATAIAANPDVLNVVVDTVIGAVNNDRSMVVTAKAPGNDTLALTAPVVTGGASQPIGVVNNILKGQPSSGALNLSVYNIASGVNASVEDFTFSLFKQTNGRGEQIYFDSIVNQGSGSSINIRVVGNPAMSTAAGFDDAKVFLLDPTTAYRQTVAWMAGGDDGLTVTTGQMVESLRQLTDRIRYPFNIMLSAGYTDTLYMQAITNLCETRGDATGILDMPANKQAAQDAYDFRMFELNIDSSYSAIYTPNVQISDISTGEDRFIPPSGPVAAAYVYNDSIRNRFAAPAGLNRGPLRQVRGLAYEYTPEELEMLNPVGINTIVNKRATGPTIMSEETLQYANSALSSIHIRRTLNDIKTTLADGLEYSLFEPNTESTRFNVVQLAESVLQPAQRNEGVYSYLIKCDEDNNPPDVIDRDVLVVDIYIKPVRVAKGILLRSFITRTGISFNEVVATFSS
ncbi:tail sheath protein [Rhizobium phage RHph_I42]|nr:tail sheath protein [Rhizobium phage RHph_I42]